MAPPKDRKRKFHRRSKNGCQTCKKRHVRCDEQRPLCTSCLQSGSDCVYPPAGPDPQALVSTEISKDDTWLSLRPTAVNADSSLYTYLGGSLDSLPEPSKRLLRHFRHYAVWGQQPVLRDLDSSILHKAVENHEYMHMCLMLSACQWAWATGSMDEVRVPFLYHKAATYQFAREQLLGSETAAQSGGTMLAISALALAEGAIGDLDTSTKHLKGFRTAMQLQNPGRSLPQTMLKMVGETLRKSRSPAFINVPDFQPTVMALLFASIWDINALPPAEAPLYGWWEESDTQGARLWQNYTSQLNLNYEIVRGFDPNTYRPRILNGDPKSSRTSFIATFFYLLLEMGNGEIDVVLVDWLLEQLIGDVSGVEDNIVPNSWAGQLWLWCVLFGAAIAASGRANNALEERQLAKWIELYDSKIRAGSRALGLGDWDTTRASLCHFIGDVDQETDEGLRRLWEGAVNVCDGSQASGIEN